MNTTHNAWKICTKSETPDKSPSFTKEYNPVRSGYGSSFFKCLQTKSSLEVWMDGEPEETESHFITHWGRKQVKKGAWGRKLCGMICSLGLLCHFVFASDRHSLSHNTRTHPPPQQGAPIRLWSFVQEVHLYTASAKSLSERQTESNQD